MTSENPKLKAVVNIRNLILGINSEWKSLKVSGQEINDLLLKADTQFTDCTVTDAHGKWKNAYHNVQHHIVGLQTNMNKVVEKINNKDSNDISAIWSAYEQHIGEILTSMIEMNDLGHAHFKDDLKRSSWSALWDNIFNKMKINQEIAKGSTLQLEMIEAFSPQDMDLLTETILKNMPINYSMEEAEQYETEYMEAYDQIKSQASQKKNIWDKFLDILAGNRHQSPAEMVMMKRWVNGEKGNL